MFKGKVNRKSEVGIFEILQRMFRGSEVPALFRGSEVPAFEAVRCQLCSVAVRCQLCMSLHALSSKVLALSCSYSGSQFARARSSIPTSFV